jgi:hypothetical protein
LQFIVPLGNRIELIDAGFAPRCPMGTLVPPRV